MRQKAFFIAFFATIVRYYDYALFGLSASILAKEFMPSESPEEQLLKFFFVFSIAVIFRPLGSIIFGTIGDKYGRGPSIKISSITGTISMGLICFLPSFGKIGIIASCILLICRILFIMSLAGETDAIKIYVREKVAKKNRNLANGIISSCSQIGALLAACSFYYASECQQSEKAIDLWRINFVLGSIFGWIVIYCRRFFVESEEFLLAKKQNKSMPQTSLFELIRLNKAQFFFSMIINGICGGIYHFLIIFWGAFSFKVLRIIDQNQLSVSNIYLISIYGICSLLSGYLADKFDNYKQIIFSIFVSLFILSLMVFFWLDYRFYAKLLVGLTPFFVVPLQVTLQSVFSTIARMRLYSLSHSLGAMIFSSSTPLICSLLWKSTGNIQILFGFLELLIILLAISFLYLQSRDFYNK